VADAEQASLALLHDLEADVLLFEAGRSSLEVAQRLPLRLADGLPGRPHAAPAAPPRAPPFFFWTRRVWGGVGFGGAGFSVAPLPEDGGVGFGREKRVGIAPGFGISRRVIRP